MLAFPESSCSPARAHLLRKSTFRPKDEECPQKLNTKGEVSGAGALKVFLHHISVPSHAIHATPGRQATPARSWGTWRKNRSFQATGDRAIVPNPVFHRGPSIFGGPDATRWSLASSRLWEGKLGYFFFVFQDYLEKMGILLQLNRLSPRLNIKKKQFWLRPIILQKPFFKLCYRYMQKP